MKFLSWATCAFFYGLVVYYCFVQLPQLMGQTTPILKWSMGIIYIVMMVGIFMLTVYSVYMALEQLVKKPEESTREKTVEEILEEVE